MPLDDPPQPEITEGTHSASSRRKTVRRLTEEGLSLNQIASRLGLVKSTVAYHRRRLGHPPDDRSNRRYEWAEVQRYHDAGHSKLDCQERFGFASQTWYMAVKRGALVPRPAAQPIDTYLVVGRRQTNRSHLKLRLLGAGLKENRCERCGIVDWQGKPLNMALHHLNGDVQDNRLENIAFLCPNCHAQTPNYGGRNGHKRRQGRSPTP